MNFLQRLITRWWALWAVNLGIEVNRVAPLPSPVVDPRMSAAQLTAEAEARGAADARSTMLNHWLFGGPGDAVSDRYDPSYIHELRHRREAALASLRSAQAITEGRISVARRRRDEATRNMEDARQRMSGMAAQEHEARIHALDEQAVAAPPDTQRQRDRIPWEGESVPLALPWRVLIIIGLVAAELPVQFYVFGRLFNSGNAAAWMSVMTSATLVLAPFVAGSLLRSRPATGAERRTGRAILVLAAGWVFTIGVLGVIRGRVLEGTAVARQGLDVSPLTLTLMFVALLLVVGAMAFMLGLSRRHPYQQAYVTNRSRRDRFESLMHMIAMRLNPEYLDPDTHEVASNEAQERAIRQAYAAAEDAYFAAITRTIGDPTLTEAVHHRRGLRAAP